MTCNIEHIPLLFIAGNLTVVLVLFTSLQNIVILSMTLVVCAGIKSTYVVCPHKGIYDLCVFAIFSKTSYVDITALCMYTYRTVDPLSYNSTVATLPAAEQECYPISYPRIWSLTAVPS